MHILNENIKLYGTYLLSFFGISFNLNDIKGLLLFVGAFILLVLQIRLHLIKISKEKREDEIAEIDLKKKKESQNK